MSYSLTNRARGGIILQLLKFKLVRRGEDKMNFSALGPVLIVGAIVMAFASAGFIPTLIVAAVGVVATIVFK